MVSGNTEFAPQLDHVVINVKEELDLAYQNYQALGFQVTERGHHSLGSSNHLAIFGQTYLELLGFESGKGHNRPELLNAPEGLLGLVFKTTDAVQLHHHLLQLGLKIEAPKSFHRPVRLENNEIVEAKFRTVTLPAELAPNGRTFYCDQLTPEYVWRDAWRQHPNQVTDIVEYVFASQHPSASAAIYKQLFPHVAIQAEDHNEYWFQAGTAKIRFLTVQKAKQEFKDIVFSDQDSERRVALVLSTKSVHAVHAALEQGHIKPILHSADAVLVGASDASGVALKFVQGK